MRTEFDDLEGSASWISSKNAMLNFTRAGFVRSLEDRMNLHHVLAEPRMNRPSSSPVVPINWAEDRDAIDAARVLSNLWKGTSKPEMVTILPRMHILPSSIGVQCAKYGPITERLGNDSGDDQPTSGKKRMQCGNNACATRRHQQEVKNRANVVCSWINKGRTRRYHVLRVGSP